jgi:hypothetical protein
MDRLDRLDQMDRRARYSVGAAVSFAGVLLMVLGWYLISGEAIAAKQLPYLASASVPGAALLVCGTVFMLSGGSGVDADTARRVAELHALLTEAIAADAEPQSDAESRPAAEPQPDAEPRPDAESRPDAEPRPDAESRPDADS